jgi:hypothetical protein
VFFQLIVEGKIGGTIFTGFNQAARPGKGTDLFVCFGRSGQKINLSPLFPLVPLFRGGVAMIVDIHSAIAELKSVRMSLPVRQELPDESLLDVYERELGVTIPGEYRTFLKEASDSVFNGKDALRVTSAQNHPRELLHAAREAWSAGVPKVWLPFCEDNGNYYCISDEGDIKFWAHDGTSSESWPTLGAWIKAVWIDEQ